MLSVEAVPIIYVYNWEYVTMYIPITEAFKRNDSFFFSIPRNLQKMIRYTLHIH